MMDNFDFCFARIFFFFFEKEFTISEEDIKGI